MTTRALVKLSPVFLGLVSLAFCISLTTFPPDLFSELMEEPDLMFGHFNTLLYMSLCVGAFILGASVFQLIRGSALQRRVEVTRSGVILVAVAFLGAGLGLLAVTQFIRDPSLFASALVAGSAESLRNTDENDTGSMLWNALPMGSAFLLWALARTIAAGPAQLRTRARLLVYGAALIYALSLTITLQRNLLIPFLISCFLVMSCLKWHPEGLSAGRIIKFLVISILLVGGLFLLIGYFRSGDTTSPFTLLVGYLPGSVNRLTAAVDGSLKPAFPDGGYYSFKFLWHPPFIRRFVDMNELARSINVTIPTTSIAAWRLEFEDVGGANLNPMFIWPTAFGYVFYDFRWLGPIYFALMGVAAAYAWKKFRAQTAFGVVMYPYIAAAIILWATDNFLSYPQVLLFLGPALGLSWIDRVKR